MKTSAGLLLCVLLASALPSVGAGTSGDPVTVYKTPSCGCCDKWVSHLRENGFKVEAVNLEDLGMVKAMAGVDPQLASCHTARVEGYVIEGHVPADDIRRLLAERPEARGLTVPGMPHGSPGMESPHPEPYEVLLIEPDGSTRVFARH